MYAVRCLCVPQIIGIYHPEVAMNVFFLGGGGGRTSEEHNSAVLYMLHILRSCMRLFQRAGASSV